MRIEITSKEIKVSDAMRARIESRFAKLERMDVPLIKPHVIITKEKDGVKVETSVGIPNGKLFAQAEHDEFYAAINALGQKLERQLTRYTEKPNAHRGQRSGKAQARAGAIGGVTEAQIDEAELDKFEYQEEQVA